MHFQATHRVRPGPNLPAAIGKRVTSHRPIWPRPTGFPLLVLEPARIRPAVLGNREHVGPAGRENRSPVSDLAGQENPDDVLGPGLRLSHHPCPGQVAACFGRRTVKPGSGFTGLSGVPSVHQLPGWSRFRIWKQKQVYPSRGSAGRTYRPWWNRRRPVSRDPFPDPGRTPTNGSRSRCPGAIPLRSGFSGRILGTPCLPIDQHWHRMENACG